MVPAVQMLYAEQSPTQLNATAQMVSKEIHHRLKDACASHCTARALETVPKEAFVWEDFASSLVTMPLNVLEESAARTICVARSVIKIPIVKSEKFVLKALVTLDAARIPIVRTWKFVSRTNVVAALASTLGQLVVGM